MNIIYESQGLALAVIRAAHDYMDFWKVGNLNHNKEVEQSVDWPKFREIVAQPQRARSL